MIGIPLVSPAYEPREPGLAPLLQLLFSIIKNLFSMTGLGAVLTFGLIQVFLGAYFYRRYKDRLEKKARKYLQSLKGQLGRIWSAELDRVANSLKDCQQELASQQKTLERHLNRD